MPGKAAIMVTKKSRKKYVLVGHRITTEQNELIAKVSRKMKLGVSETVRYIINNFEETVWTTMK